MRSKLLPFALVLAGCTTNVELDAGVYPLFQATLDGTDLETLPNVVLSIDPEAGDAIFTEGADLLFAAILGELPEEAWMTGCNDGLDNATMATFSLSGADVVVGDLVFDDPVIYPDCATNGYVHLQDGSGSVTCGEGPCALFASPLAIYGGSGD